jgi:hypothetical protein
MKSSDLIAFLKSESFAGVNSSDGWLALSRFYSEQYQYAENLDGIFSMVFQVWSEWLKKNFRAIKLEEVMGCYHDWFTDASKTSISFVEIKTRQIMKMASQLMCAEMADFEVKKNWVVKRYSRYHLSSPRYERYDEGKDVFFETEREARDYRYAADSGIESDMRYSYAVERVV